MDELLVDGVVSFSEQEHCWVASIDWQALRHASDKNRGQANGVDQPALPSRKPA